MLAVASPAIDIDALGERLAQARLTGGLADVDLAGLAGLDEAEDLRDAVLRSLGWAQVGSPSSGRIRLSRGRCAWTAPLSPR